METLLPRRWWALIGVSLATFMAFLDNNVVNVALPSIQHNLHLTISGLEWVVSSYILVLAGLMLVGGRLADLYGRRRVFLTGLTVFTLSSLLAGLAHSESVLIAARSLQGVGAAAMLPPVMAIIQVLFPEHKERERALGVWMGVSGLALALGPFTGGLISQHLNWGWIFLINVPFGVITFAIAVLTLTETREQVRHRLDLPGLVTSSAALFAITYALIEGHDRGWTSAQILTCFIGGGLALIAFVALELRTDDPMVDMSMFRSPVFSGGLATLMLWGFGVMGIYFFTSMYLQNVLGMSPTVAGSAFIPMALFMAGLSPVAPLLASRIGTDITVALGTAIIVGSMLYISTIGAHGHFADLLAPFIAYGIGSGLVMAPVNAALMGAVSEARAGAAGGVINAAREISGLLGVTIVGAVLTTRTAHFASTGATPVHAFLDGYRFAIMVASVIVAVGVPVSLLTLRRRQPITAATEPVAEPEVIPV